MKIIITGREQALSCAEAESLFGSVKILNDHAIQVPVVNVDINQLGGAIKIADIINRLQIKPINLVPIVSETILSIISQPKFNFGISYYGKGSIPKNLGFKIKRHLQKLGKNPRLVQGTKNHLNAATIINNQLTSKGIEILILDTPDGLIIARTTAVQNIDSYSKRDYEKPCRDSKNGMLPPKLSQMLINLTKPDARTTIVDPFCGSGGLLIESMLMALNSDGSDINQEMVNCTKLNLSWLSKEYHLNLKPNLSVADASQRSYEYEQYCIASEGYLGENFSNNPQKSTILKQKSELEKLYLDFFTNLSTQKVLPRAICICAPFWMIEGTKVRLNIIDDVTKLGYTYSEFKSVGPEALDYRREGQYTSRQILVFKTN